jgi:hypothetical protein
VHSINELDVKILLSSPRGSILHYLTMVAPSRHNSLGNADSNPSLQENYPPVLTVYEVARERRKKELHDHVELAFKSRRIELDARVSVGDSPTVAAPIVRNSGKCKEYKRSAIPEEAEAPPLRIVCQNKQV